MLLKIKKIILEENILDNIAKLGANPYGTPDSSSSMNGRAEKFMPLSAEDHLNKATGFKAQQGEMSLDRNKRDFITGHNPGTQANASDLFKAQRMQLLNNGGK